MRIWIARRPSRLGYYLPMQGTIANPALIVPLTKHLENNEIDELVRENLEKQGITSESEVKSVTDAAEAAYEQRVKVGESQWELRRLMGLRKEGKSLMQSGFRKWRETFYPAVSKIQKGEIK